MVVSEAIGHETILFGISVLVGAGLLFLYDMLRIFRRIVPHGNLWIGVEDFWYWLVCTGGIFVMLYRENDGRARGFALGGVLLGMALYYLLFSRLVIRVNVLVLKAVLGFFGKTGKVLFGPLVRVLKKTGRFFRKELKKFLRAVKISLCKL